nr:immunoglobulin heavy chain junction region [Macaca mulatta]
CARLWMWEGRFDVW